ncbi:NRAMP family divalent metal transporter [Candidatus Latescibacterota bacterium]
MSNFLSNNPLTRFIRNVVGPAAIMAAGMIGAGAVSTRLLAGAWFGFDLLWVALYVIPMVLFTLDSASRVGNITGRGMIDMIKTEIHPALAWFMLIPTSLLNIIVNMGQMSVMAEGIYGISGMDIPEGGEATTGLIIITVILTVISLLIVLFGGFKRLVKVMTGLLFLILVCFIIVAIKGLTEWKTWIGLIGGLIPKLPADVQVVGSDGVRRAFTQLMGIAGQALPASVFLSFGYFTSNAEYTAADIKASFKKNILNFVFLWGMFSVIVVVAGTTALHNFYIGANGGLHYSQIETVADAARVLAPALPGFLQPITIQIFSLGLLVAGFTTLVSVAMLQAYFCLDIVGKNWKYTKDNKLFRWTFGLWIAVPALLSPFWSLPALIKAILAMAGNLILAPIAVLIIIYFINKKKYVSEFTAGTGRNIFLGITFVFSMVIVVYGVMKLFG